jgi:hypothetical protein
MAIESWVGRVQIIVLSTGGEKEDWVVVRLSNEDAGAPKMYALELGRRTPAALAQLNLLRDAMSESKQIRLWVDRDTSSSSWQSARIREVEYPKLPIREFFV